MISYSNFGSSREPQASKMRESVELLHKSNPDMMVDGETVLPMGWDVPSRASVWLVELSALHAELAA